MSTSPWIDVIIKKQSSLEIVTIQSGFIMIWVIEIFLGLGKYSGDCTQSNEKLLHKT